MKNAMYPNPSKDLSIQTPLGRMLGFRLNRLSAKIGRLADREAAEVAQISLPEYRTLVVLDALGHAGVTALQEALSIDKAWVSRTLGKLLDGALVSMAPDPQDARRNVYSLTRRGKGVAARLMERAVVRNSRYTQGLSATEQRTLMRLLERVENNVANAFDSGV